MILHLCCFLNPNCAIGIAAVKSMMLEAASQRGLMTPERWEAALKDGADLHQVLHATYKPSDSIIPPSLLMHDRRPL